MSITNRSTTNRSTTADWFGIDLTDREPGTGVLEIDQYGMTYPDTVFIEILDEQDVNNNAIVEVSRQDFDVMIRAYVAYSGMAV